MIEQIKLWLAIAGILLGAAASLALCLAMIGGFYGAIVGFGVLVYRAITG